MTEMRMLTVQQPAAGAIVALGKTVENRSWSTNYRGLLAIHAGLREMPDDHPFWEFGPYRDALNQATSQQRHALDHHGVIIGVADLVDVHQCEPGCCASPWAERGLWPVHWVLENIRPLRTPHVAKGGLGLRMVDITLADRVLAEATP